LNAQRHDACTKHLSFLRQIIIIQIDFIYSCYNKIIEAYYPYHAKPLTEKVTTPVEAMLGLNAKLKNLPIAFNLNGGLALIRGAGTPLFRTLAGMTIGM